MKRIATTVIILLCMSFTMARAAIGEWAAYMAYGEITDIEPAGNTIYVLSSGSLFSYNVNDQSLSIYNKVYPLSDTGIAHIAWCNSSKRLVIIYNNQNIDLLGSNGEVTNINDYYNKSMTDDKTVNNITVSGNHAYLSTGFGILKMNIKDAEISDTYNLGMNVTDCAVDGSTIYAKTSNGIYAGNTSDNLPDRNNWKITSASVSFNDANDITISNANGYTEYTVYDNTNKCYWSNQKDGKLQGYKLEEGNTKTIIAKDINPDGPASNNFYRLYIHNGKLYAVAGLWSQETDGNYPGEVHVWDGNSWTEFEQPSAEILGHNYVDLLCMDFDPLKEGHVMVGAKSGLYEFQDGKFIKCHNGSNSLLSSPFALPDGYDYTIVTSVKYDDTGCLWTLNSLVSNTIKSFSSTDNQWKEYQHQDLSGTSNYNLQKLLISKSNGKMWFVNNFYQASSLFSYDYVNDVLDGYGADMVNQDGAKVTADYIFCTTEDKRGNIWIGTSAGPLYITANDISYGSKTFTQHKVPRNDGTNYADYLLSGIEVRAIAVDGGNRKWIGTGNNGVFLISDDCNTQIHHFTTDNSALPSNIIIDIAIDEITGRVFIATDKGLCSYTSDATEPTENMTKDNVTAYPNPVTPDYTGQITIVGLSNDASVKIVTANGTLVNDGRSTGGTYVWDGCDLNGRRVASGIYMVETATQSGDKGTVCKIAIIR